MTSRGEADELRDLVRRLIREADTDVVSRYTVRPRPGTNLNLYRRLRRVVGRVLRKLKVIPSPSPEPWLAGLNRVPGSESAAPLLIWAVGSDAATHREACLALHRRLSSLPEYAPVLVTDRADFAFYARLDWLVEFVPSGLILSQGYGDRKMRYLAWLYRGAPVVPLSLGVRSDVSLEEFV